MAGKGKSASRRGSVQEVHDPEFDVERVFLSGNAADEIVCDVLEDVVSRGADLIYEHYLEERIPSYAAGRALEDVFAAVRRSMTGHDADSGLALGEKEAVREMAARGEGVGVPQCLPAPVEARENSDWTVGRPPKCARPDAWARSSVRLGVKRVEEVVEVPESAPRVEEKTVSMADGVSYEVEGRPDTAEMEHEQSRFVQQELDIPDRPKSRGIGVESKLKSRATAETSIREAAAAASRERKMLAAVRQRAEEAAVAAEAALLKRFEEEAKGRKYTLDERGRLIIVRNVRADRVPPSNVEVPVRVTSRGATPASRGAAGRLSTGELVFRPVRRAVTVEKKTEEDAVVRGVDRPELDDVVPAPGVTMLADDRVIADGEEALPSGSITRQQWQHHRKTGTIPTLTGVDSAGAGGSLNARDFERLGKKPINSKSSRSHPPPSPEDLDDHSPIESPRSPPVDETSAFEGGRLLPNASTDSHPILPTLPKDTTTPSKQPSNPNPKKRQTTYHQSPTAPRPARRATTNPVASKLLSPTQAKRPPRSRQGTLSSPPIAAKRTTEEDAPVVKRREWGETYLRKANPGAVHRATPAAARKLGLK